MTAPAQQPASGQAGLLERLLAAVRIEFRADHLALRGKREDLLLVRDHVRRYHESRLRRHSGGLYAGTAAGLRLILREGRRPCRAVVHYNEEH